MFSLTFLKLKTVLFQLKSGCYRVLDLLTHAKFEKLPTSLALSFL